MSILIPANLSGLSHRVKEKQKEVPSQESSSVSGSGSNAGLATMGSAGMSSQEEYQAPAATLKPDLEREIGDTSPRGFRNSLEPTSTTKYDQYGAELGKEARVWDVYVKETDKWDTELVEGWNNFLIESSKQLQPDPSEASAKALYLISQTLLLMNSNNRTFEPNTLALANNTSSFEPTQHAIIINTLWYLSLSLSIATSLIAMFAKDWCHSFITSRHGSPWLQARRRQQKWNMIEKWKMQELLLVLPSLIHLSLLLLLLVFASTFTT
ncbi:transmembrane protein, putative [Rhizoctonia solani AG-3 Rhs1AP]|uniref:Transmembrane protein, putative n=1 Tax=Rhizoctonia solani AG-3 Rhs1AP TaxID=1086054 RepID=X8JG06_9AGAM|nr:transmembrane protein, putative [Rhizoctonia solani AG-3 Rhs1AP]